MKQRCNIGTIIMVALAAIAIIVMVFTLIESKDTEDIDIPNNEHFYDISTAKKVIREDYGYDVDTDIEVVSENGAFYYRANIVTQKYDFLTITGHLEFTAEYSPELEEWKTSIKAPHVEYDWHLSGKWYAKTQSGYYVYLDVITFNSSRMRVIAEAKYDSTSGGQGSYDEQDQLVSLTFSKTGSGIADVCLTGNINGGYPYFYFEIKKDKMYIWQTYDGIKGEFVSIQ